MATSLPGRGALRFTRGATSVGRGAPRFTRGATNVGRGAPRFTRGATSVGGVWGAMSGPPMLNSRDDAVGEDADALNFRLELVALLEELAEGRAHALGRAGGDHVAGQEREALREHGDALVHRKDHLGRVTRLARLAVHAQRDVERLRIGDLVGRDQHRPHRTERVERLALEPLLVKLL